MIKELSAGISTEHAGVVTVWCEKIAIHLFPRKGHKFWGYRKRNYGGEFVSYLAAGPFLLVAYCRHVD